MLSAIYLLKANAFANLVWGAVLLPTGPTGLHVDSGGGFGQQFFYLSLPSSHLPYKALTPYWWMVGEFPFPSVAGWTALQSRHLSLPLQDLDTKSVDGW